MNSRAHIMQGSVGAWLYTDIAGIAQAPGSAGYESLLLWPRATTHPNLTAASGSFASIRGPIAVDWSASPSAFSLRATVPANTAAEVRLPFPAGTPLAALLATDGVAPQTCAAAVPEGADAVFSCDAGATILNVSFASFGTPTGTCATGFKAGACNAASSRAVVAAACVGLGSCSVTVGDAAFGDPCNGQVKVFSGAIVCSGGGAGVVFANGSYVPGVPGVTGASVDAASSTLSVTTGSGDFAFMLQWA